MKRIKVIFITILSMVVFYLLPKGFFVEKGQTYTVGMDVKSSSPLHITVNGLDNNENKWIPIKKEYEQTGEFQQIKGDFGKSEIRKVSIIFKGALEDLELKKIHIQVGNDKRYLTRRELRKLVKYNVNKLEITPDLTVKVETSNKSNVSLTTFKYLDYDVGSRSLAGQILCFLILLGGSFILFDGLDFEEIRIQLMTKGKITKKIFYLIEVITVIALPIGILVKGKLYLKQKIYGA